MSRKSLIQSGKLKTYADIGVEPDIMLKESINSKEKFEEHLKLVLDKNKLSTITRVAKIDSIELNLY